MFPVCGCGSSGSRSRFTLWFTHALPQLGASREAAFPAGAGPPPASPQDYCQISVAAVESGWAVSPWWSSRGVAWRGEASRSEAKGEITTPGLDLGWAGL